MCTPYFCSFFYFRIFRLRCVQPWDSCDVMREDQRVTVYRLKSDSEPIPKVSESDSEKKLHWYFISSFTRSFADKQFAKRTPKQLYGHLPSLFIYRACYAKRSPRYHLVHDTRDYSAEHIMPQTVRGPNPNKNWPNPVVPW